MTEHANPQHANPQHAHRQPYLHELIAAVRAPSMALCNRDGQIVGAGVAGIYLGDRRIVSRSVLTVDGDEPTAVVGELDGASATRSVSIARSLGDVGADPTVWVQRLRTVSGDCATETIELRNAASRPVDAGLRLSLAADLADIAEVKAGRAGPALAPSRRGPSLVWTVTDGSSVTASASPPPAEIDCDAEQGGLSWRFSLPPGSSAWITIEFRLHADPTPPVVAPVSGESLLRTPQVSAGDRRLEQLLAQSLADLSALELQDVLEPADHFLAAGVPWFLTLFGRDCIIAARMLLPLGTDLAAGTLRTLARRQGSRVDALSAEEPGKILHELRRAETDHSGDGTPVLRLPPTYYGTVDATPLWVLLLHDAWRWGMPAAEVRALLPALERALAWMRDYGVNDAGFLSYLDRSGSGLSNQGWKDSGNSIRFADGRLAEAPVALSEVQAYGYSAAMHGADLLDAFGRPGGQNWRQWATALADRFRRSFWVSDEHGRYPALALDGSGRPVDAPASNMGHLLGTGLLNAEESALVAARLGSPELSSGFGLRTMATTAAGYNPFSYHGGVGVDA